MKESWKVLLEWVTGFGWRGWDVGAACLSARVAPGKKIAL